MVLLTLLFSFFQSSLSIHELDYLGFIAAKEKFKPSCHIKITHLNGGCAHLYIEAHLHDHFELIWCGISSGLINDDLGLRMITLPLNTT